LNEGFIFTYSLSKVSFCIATNILYDLFIYNWYLVYWQLEQLELESLESKNATNLMLQRREGEKNNRRSYIGFLFRPFLIDL